uniref:Uncharacterized protein n=1 Tax=Picea sitchensis TaxID=3332 RepID=A9NVD0_PICSI|nr:unknown [Picea sitchensis]
MMTMTVRMNLLMGDLTVKNLKRRKLFRRLKKRNNQQKLRRKIAVKRTAQMRVMMNRRPNRVFR